MSDEKDDGSEGGDEREERMLSKIMQRLESTKDPSKKAKLDAKLQKVCNNSLYRYMPLRCTYIRCFHDCPCIHAIPRQFVSGHIRTSMLPLVMSPSMDKFKETQWLGFRKYLGST